MKARALGRGDDHGRCPGARGLGHGDSPRGADGPGDALDRGKRLGLASRREVAVGDGEAESDASVREPRKARLRGTLRADGIGRIVPLHHVVGDGKVPHRVCERTHVVEADAEERGARPRQPAIGRLEPEHAAEGGRHADGAVRVRAQGEGNEPSPHRGAGATR